MKLSFSDGSVEYFEGGVLFIGNVILFFDSIC